MGRECLPTVAMVVLVQLGFAAMNVVSKLALDTDMSSYLEGLNKSTVPDTGIIQTKKMSEKFSASYTSTAIMYLMDRSLSVWKKLGFDIKQHSQLCLYIGVVGSAMAFALISWYVATLRITIASMGRECQPTVAMVLVQRGFAGMNVVSKLALDTGMSPLVAYRHLIAGVFLVPIAFYFKRGSWMVITKKLLLQIFFCSIFGYIGKRQVCRTARVVVVLFLAAAVHGAAAKGYAAPGASLTEASLQDVRVEPGTVYRQAQQTNLEYLLRLDVDRLASTEIEEPRLFTPPPPPSLPRAPARVGLSAGIITIIVIFAVAVAAAGIFFFWRCCLNPCLVAAATAPPPLPQVVVHMPPVVVA